MVNMVDEVVSVAVAVAVAVAVTMAVLRSTGLVGGRGLQTA